MGHKGTIVIIDSFGIQHQFVKVIDILLDNSCNVLELRQFMTVMLREHAFGTHDLVAELAEVLNLLLRVPAAKHLGSLRSRALIEPSQEGAGLLLLLKHPLLVFRSVYWLLLLLHHHHLLLHPLLIILLQIRQLSLILRAHLVVGLPLHLLHYVNNFNHLVIRKQLLGGAILQGLPSAALRAREGLGASLLELELLDTAEADRVAAAGKDLGGVGATVEVLCAAIALN